MEQFTAIIIPDQDERPGPEDMDTNERHAKADAGRNATTQTRPQNIWQASPGHGKAATSRSGIQQGRASEEATSPERRAYNAPVDNATKNKCTNRFEPLEKEQSEEGIGNDIVKEGSIVDASNSKGSRMRDPMTLTPEILAMLERHEPDKAKQAKLLTDYLSGQMTLPSTEEELQQHLERKAKREADKLMVAAEAKAARQDKIKQAKASRQAQNATVIATFAKRAEH